MQASSWVAYDREFRRVATTPGKRRDPRRDILRQLGERVRSVRRERGFTQQTLAKLLDLSIAYVSLIERGERNPPYTTVVAIARALRISPRDICE